MELNHYLNAGLRILLVGPPGCGKTARVAAAAAATGRRLIVLRASLMERIDMGGCLVPDLAGGVTRALPLELLKDLQTTSVPTLLVYDDLGQAPIDVQAALMRSFDDGFLSPAVTIWGATNRPGDKAGVSALCEPLRSRFHLAFSVATPDSEDKPDGGVLSGIWFDPTGRNRCEVGDWIEWALDNGAPAEIAAWHRSTGGQELYKWRPCADPSIRMADFRSWEIVIRLWNSGMRDLQSIAAAIGKPAAAAFLAFARLADQLPTPDQVWIDPDGAPVPADPSALFLIASNLAAAVTPGVVGPMVRYLSRLPRIYGAFLGRDAYRRLGAKLSGCREWVQWFTQNQELFASGGAR